MDNMTGQPKPSLRGKWHQYSQICCKVTDTVSTTAYKAWKHALIVKNQSLNPSNPWRKTFTERLMSPHTHVLMCSNPRLPFQRMSFLYLLYNTCFFSKKVIVFRTAKDCADVQLFSSRAGCWPAAPSWHMALVHYQLGSPLPARFPGCGWTKSL